MKRHIFSLLFILTTSHIALGQIPYVNKIIRILSIEEHKDAYVIKCLDDSLDTINILSCNKRFVEKCRYDKIKIGASYNFHLAPTPSYDMGKLVIKCGNTIFWKSGDKAKDYPRFALNIIGIYIEEDD